MGSAAAPGSNDIQCAECAMRLLRTDEYHPQAACLMFRACGNPETVRANLEAVLRDGAGSVDADAFARTSE